MDRKGLEAKLAELQAKLPELVKQHPDEDEFYPAFVAEAEAITAHASSRDLEWVETEIAKLLANVGKLGKT